ncbi:helix-turn-helix domain-containing protein [Emticicia fontis]
MEVICLEEKAFYVLIEKVVDRITEKKSVVKEKWIPELHAMQLLNIKSKTTMQKLRDEGKIRFSQPQKKVILYDRDSIQQYLEANVKETF